jgi:hypothetical protein
MTQMYGFAKQKEVKELAEWCKNILHAVQKEVRDYFTFDIQPIGSGRNKLVTQNAEEAFDLDYNIVLQRDKKNLLNDPKQIKDIFINGFNKVLKEKVEGFDAVTSDSASVVTVKQILIGELKFSFDVAIIVESNDGIFYRLTNDKKTKRYIWNEVANSRNYMERFQNIKNDDHWVDFKKRYLELKNMHLKRQDEINSFSIFLETINEFEQGTR